MTSLVPLQLSSPEVHILNDLESHIRRRYRGLLREFHLEPVGTRVVLHGTATSYFGKQMAQEEVLGVGGLGILANRIDVYAGTDSLPYTTV